MIYVIFGPTTRSWRGGRCLKGFPGVARFAVTEYGVVGSHGEPIHARNYGLGRFWDMWQEEAPLPLQEEICILVQ